MRSPATVHLRGRWVDLVPLGEAHRSDLVAAATDDPRSLQFLASNLAALGWERWFGEAAEGVARGHYVAWAIVECATGRAIGSTRFGDIAPQHERLEIGWTWLAPAHRGTAANPEAKYLQLAYAFEDLQAGRVSFATDGRNVRSQRALERLGAVREGVLRRHFRLADGFVRDSVYYSILADEWPAVRDGLFPRIGGASEIET